MGARRHRWARRLLDLVVYAVGMTLAVGVALVPASLLAGAGLNGVKYGLFAVGVLAFGYATLLLWPARPGETTVDRGGGGLTDPDGGRLSGSDAGDRSTANVAGRGETVGREETTFEELVGRVPPLSWYRLPPTDRLHPGTKLYVASAFMLAVSYAMEAVFGIQV